MVCLRYSEDRSVENGERGQDLAEFAVALPVLLLLLLGIIEFGILVYSYNAISNAAREGARYGIVHPATNGDGNCGAPGSNTILAAACALTVGLDDAAVGVDTTVTNPTNVAPGQVTVVVTYTAQLITAPLIDAFGGNGAIPLAASATMNREQ